MTGSQFIKIIKYLSEVFWSFFKIAYRTPITKNICFGQVVIVALVFFLVVYFIVRPINRT